MDSENGDDGRVRVSPQAAESAAGATGEDRRVEELLEVNARLAAEVRSLSLGLASAPRSEQATASRRLAALIDERDTLLERLGEKEHALEVERAHRGELEAANFELGGELHYLRAGARGMLRRAFGLLFRA
jgi:hypothetical protein